MYTEFYNLKTKPFNLTPSPNFLYLGEVHKEALALLNYGVVERKGFILLTGEVGTGKTTILNAFRGNLNPDIKVVYLSNPLISRMDIFNYIAFSIFKKEKQYKTKIDFILDFESYLKILLQHQRNFVLIIDEAHKLSFDLLEEIRLLSNLETAEEKLINIFLVGQPELNAKLNEQRCRPLRQRISIRYHLQALNLEDTRKYIYSRLKIAGVDDGRDIFPRDVINSLYKFSEGNPRMINILADNAMLLGYSRGSEKITPAIVKECYEDLNLKGSFNEKPETRPVAGEADKKTIEKSIAWLKWTIFIILILIISLIPINRMGNSIIEKWRDFPDSSSQDRNDTPPQNSIIKKKVETKDDQVEIKTSNVPGQIVEANIESEIPTKLDEKIETDSDEKGIVEDRSSESVKSIIVKNGDTLAGLAVEVYGKANENILKFLQDHNPEITDVNIIDVGHRIVFPPLDSDNMTSFYSVHISSYERFGSAKDLFQKLTSEGYEAYIIPIYTNRMGTLFRITLGNFRSITEAEKYAAQIIEQGISEHARPVQIEMK